LETRYENLDLLRGFASLVVVVGHSSWILGADNFGIDSISLAKLSVAIFLSLSGFVIGINYKPYTFEFKDYVKKLFIILFLLLLTCILLTFVLDLIRFNLSYIDNHFEASCNLPSFLTSIFLLDQFFLLQYLTPGNKINSLFEEFGSNRVLWTLTLEWSIYMLYGFLFSKPSKKTKKLTIILLPYIITGCLSFFYTRIPFISMCWLLGFLISLRKEHSFALLLIYSLSVISISLSKNNETIYLLAPIIIYCFNKFDFHSSVTSFGNFWGNISYSLYLCHYPIILIAAPIFIVFGQIVAFFTVILISIVTSFFLYFYIDRNRKNLLLMFNFKL